MSPVYFDDGVRVAECDKCSLEIRSNQKTVGVKVYHEDCTPS